MKLQNYFVFAVLLLCPLLANAALVVTVDQPKISGSKAVVTLTMKNTLTEQIESARAAVFLLDEQGKMVGQSTKWVIGSGPNNAKSALPSPLAQILQLRRKRPQGVAADVSRR